MLPYGIECPSQWVLEPGRDYICQLLPRLERGRSAKAGVSVRFALPLGDGSTLVPESYGRSLCTMPAVSIQCTR